MGRASNTRFLKVLLCLLLSVAAVGKWIGTQTGLFRYDGSRVMKMTAVEPLVGHYIDTVQVAPDKSIWIVGIRGVARFQYDQFVAVPLTPEAGNLPSSAQGVAVNRQGAAGPPYRLNSSRLRRWPSPGRCSGPPRPAR